MFFFNVKNIEAIRNKEQHQITGYHQTGNCNQTHAHSLDYFAIGQESTASRHRAPKRFEDFAAGFL
jgi:hypothetical protein